MRKMIELRAGWCQFHFHLLCMPAIFSVIFLQFSTLSLARENEVTLTLFDTLRFRTALENESNQILRVCFFLCARLGANLHHEKFSLFFLSRVVAFIFCVLALHPIRDHSHTPSPSSTRAEGRDGSVRETRIFLHSLISQEIVAQFIYFVLLLLASLFSLFI